VRRGAALARERLAVPEATRELLLGTQRMEPAAELKALAALDGIFAPEAKRRQAAILLELGRTDEALRAVRASIRAGTPRVGEARLLELRILKGTPDFAPAYRRALLDLEPFTVYEDVKKLAK
jgi:hypothetical protein